MGSNKFDLEPGDIFIDIDSAAVEVLSIKKCNKCGKTKYYGEDLESNIFGWWHEREVAGMEEEVFNNAQ